MPTSRCMSVGLHPGVAGAVQVDFCRFRLLAGGLPVPSLVTQLSTGDASPAADHLPQRHQGPALIATSSRSHVPRDMCPRIQNVERTPTPSPREINRATG
jgi:hypothetical protein